MSKQDMLFTAENLCKLADYIDQNVEQDQLNMKRWRSDWDSSVECFKEELFFSLYNCGTCGCALGWSPFHPDMPTEKWMFSYLYLTCLNWRLYSVHYYPSLSRNNSELQTMAFGANQSSDKASVIGRLREVAKELRERAA